MPGGWAEDQRQLRVPPLAALGRNDIVGFAGIFPGGSPGAIFGRSFGVGGDCFDGKSVTGRAPGTFRHKMLPDLYKKVLATV